MENEQYLAGVDSIQLAKGLSAGYGVYASNLRLFGLRRHRAAEPLQIGREFGTISLGNLSAIQSSRIIAELEKKKDFEVAKDEILSIETKRPPGLFRMGHLVIRIRSGGEIKIKVGKNNEYEQLKSLVQAFHPDALRLL